MSRRGPRPRGVPGWKVGVGVGERAGGGKGRAGRGWGLDIQSKLSKCMKLVDAQIACI